MFGRSRGSGAPSPPAQASEHPLLRPEVEAEPAARGGGRRFGRHEGGQLDDILQSLDGVVGGDAMYLLDRLMAQTGSRPGEVIRVQYEGPGSAVLDFQMSRNGERDASHISAPVAADLADSSPQPTVTRWSEEERLVVGQSANERIATIGTWVVIALLPEARLRLESERKRLAEEEAEAERKAEEARKEAEATKAADPASSAPVDADNSLLGQTAAADATLPAPEASSENASNTMDVEAEGRHRLLPTGCTLSDGHT